MKWIDRTVEINALKNKNHEAAYLVVSALESQSRLQCLHDSRTRPAAQPA